MQSEVLTLDKGAVRNRIFLFRCMVDIIRVPRGCLRCSNISLWIKKRDFFFFFFFFFFFSLSLSKRLVMYKDFEKGKEVLESLPHPPPPPLPHSATFSGLARHHSMDAMLKHHPWKNPAYATGSYALHFPLKHYKMWTKILVGFTRIAVNFKFHSWFANFKLT